VAFWADQYSLTDQPLTSKDIDFCGERDAARLCARRLNGTSRIPTMDDQTPNSAVVEFVDDDGIKREIDFLDAPFGLSAKEVRDLSQDFAVQGTSGNDTGATFRVMHPLHCLMSRTSNSGGLPGYDTPHALQQLRYSVQILRRFIEWTLLGEHQEVRGALKLIERTFHFSHSKPNALLVFDRHGIDVFDAVPPKGFGLPKKYEELRYPQMLRYMSFRRQQFSRSSLPPASR
jgi:hypothetical protein